MKTAIAFLRGLWSDNDWLTLSLLAIWVVSILTFAVSMTRDSLKQCTQQDNYLLDVNRPCMKGYDLDASRPGGVICVCKR